MGDFETRSSPDFYFLKYYKKAQGISALTNFKLGPKKESPLLRISASGAIAKGKVARNTFLGTEGNQGPYRLKGTNNESFIIVLSGTERVFLNGELMVRGQQNDYTIDYNTAEITFTPKRLIIKD